MLRWDLRHERDCTVVENMGARKTPRARDSKVYGLAEWTRHVEVPLEMFESVATDQILDAQLHRPL
jgi:hypothetical protein